MKCLRCRKEAEGGDEELCVDCSEFEEFRQLDKLDPWYELPWPSDEGCEHCIGGFPKHELEGNKCPYCGSKLTKVRY